MCIYLFPVPVHFFKAPDPDYLQHRFKASIVNDEYFVEIDLVILQLSTAHASRIVQKI